MFDIAILETPTMSLILPLWYRSTVKVEIGLSSYLSGAAALRQALLGRIEGQILSRLTTTRVIEVSPTGQQIEAKTDGESITHERMFSNIVRNREVVVS